MEASIENCDAVLISDIKKKQKLIEGKIYNPYQKFAQAGIKKAFDCKKDVFCCMDLCEEEQKLYMEEARKRGVRFEYLKLQKLYNNEITLKYKTVGMPVVCIGEMIPECDGYNIFVKLIQRFQKDGIRAVGLSEDKYNVLYNQIPLEFWNGSSPGEMVKIVNNYVNDIEKKLCPDILIIKLPNPMVAYDDQMTFDYGTMAYIILQAIKVDFLVYCCLGGYWMPEFMDNIDMNFCAKFGNQISAFHFSNQLVDQTTETREDITTIHMPIKEVQQEVTKLRLRNNYSAYNLLNPQDFNLFYNRLRMEILDLTYGVI